MIALPVFFVFAVFVTVTGQQLTILPMGESLVRPIQNALILTCEVEDAKEKVNYDLKWFGPDKQQIVDKVNRLYIEEDGESTLKLYLTRIEATDGGKYSCNATIDGAVRQKTVNLVVFGDIEFADTNSTQIAEISKDAIIQCIVTGSPTPTVTWRFGGRKLNTGRASRYETTEKGLKVKNVTLDDKGEYTCRAEVETDGRYAERKINVEVHIPPRIVDGPGDVEGVEGAEVSLTCKAAEGEPAPKYEFLKINKKDQSKTTVTATDRITVSETNGRLQFKPVRSSDAGDYICRAYNDVGSVTAQGTLSVLVKAKISQLNNVTAKEDDSAVITCHSDGNPAPNMTFSRSGREPYTIGFNDNGRVEVKLEKDGVLKLIIKKAKQEDAGDYVCQTRNGIGSDQSTTSLIVQYKPHFVANQSRVAFGWAGSTRNLSCSAAGNPTPRIVWLTHGNIISNNRTYHINGDAGVSVLTIKVEEVDQSWIYANYTCRATNQISQASMDISFRRASVPSKPRQVTVARYTTTMLVLGVMAPEEDGGMPVTGYRVQYENKTVVDFAADAVIKLQNLRPNTSYTLSIRAKNEVGTGDHYELTAATDVIRQPDPVVIISPKDGQLARSYKVVWETPETGGLNITQYRFRIRPKHDNKTSSADQKSDKWRDIYSDDKPQTPMVEYTIDNLKENTAYELKIWARNQIDWSKESETFAFHTSHLTPEEAAVMSTAAVGPGLVVAIIVLVLILVLVVVDVSCFCVNSRGLTAFLCARLCGRSGPCSKESAAEDGESKEALTDKQPPPEQTTVSVPLEPRDEAPAEAPADDLDKKPLLTKKKKVPTATLR